MKDQRSSTYREKLILIVKKKQKICTNAMIDGKRGGWMDDLLCPSAGWSVYKGSTVRTLVLSGSVLPVALPW